jgi:hypothetical protein
MKRLVVAIAALACLSLPGRPFAQESVTVYSGFLTGEKYLELSEPSRAAYAMGLLDGFLGSAFYGAQSAKLEPLRECIAGMTNTQLRAVLDQYVRANPVMWQYSMNVLGTNAFLAACPGIRPGPNNSSKPTPLRGAA